MNGFRSFAALSAAAIVTLSLLLVFVGFRAPKHSRRYALHWVGLHTALVLTALIGAVQIVLGLSGNGSHLNMGFVVAIGAVVLFGVVRWRKQRFIPQRAKS